MLSTKHQIEQLNEDETFLAALQMASGSVLPMALRAAVELDIFEIIAKAGPGAELSSSQIASHIATTNPDAPSMIDRTLRFLATHCVLTCRLSPDDADRNAKLLYSLGPLCKHFVRNSDGLSLAPLILLMQDKVVLESWYRYKDAIIEGGIPFNKAHGMHAFEYPEKDDRFNKIFNETMVSGSKKLVRKMLESYNGFEGVKEVLDVGGGLGATLAAIVGKYPNIRGINFDLPHVIKDAPACPGVEHVAGDMFQSVPKGEVIFLKWILHDWGDDHCLKILKNCWNALPESGKLIVVESILGDCPETGLMPKCVSRGDITMLTLNPGGKERTEKQFKELATEAGFTGLKLICPADICWVIEIYK